MNTTRLTLTPFSDRDADALLAMFRDAHVRRFLLDDQLVDAAWLRDEIRASCERFARGEIGLYTARLKEDGALVGFAGMRPFEDPPELQILYGILPALVGQGLATEMARAVVDTAFLRCGMNQLRGATDGENVASVRVLERLGFSAAPRKNDSLRFMLTRDNYRPNVRPSRPSDRPTIRTLVEAAFGQRGEADLVEALEDGGHVVASIVATVGDDPVGHIVFSELPLRVPNSNETIRGVALAPVAISPALQRRGLGGVLIEAGLAACRDAGAQVAVVLGHQEYYPRFGFSAELARRIRAPWSGPSFMALELLPNALADAELTAEYAPPFLAFE